MDGVCWAVKSVDARRRPHGAIQFEVVVHHILSEEFVAPFADSVCDLEKIQQLKSKREVQSTIGEKYKNYCLSTIKRSVCSTFCADTQKYRLREFYNRP